MNEQEREEQMKEEMESYVCENCGVNCFNKFYTHKLDENYYCSRECLSKFIDIAEWTYNGGNNDK